MPVLVAPDRARDRLRNGRIRLGRIARGAAVALALALLASAASTVRADGDGYAGRDDVRAFAAGVAARRGLDEGWVLAQLARAERRPASQRLMMPPPPGQAKNWSAYRARFVEPQRIEAGAAFWRDHEEALRRAEARFGVPPEIVVGIVGVETFYGRITGNFRVLDALATLAFDFPSGRSDRSAFFRDELEEFLVLARRENLDPAAVEGSFAGAIGLPQFMPGSINRYALDFDGDGHIDLRGSAADAIGSVAQFLAQHGWRRGLPPTFDVVPPTDLVARARMLVPDIQPTFAPAEFTAAGARLSPAAQALPGPFALVMVENGDGPASFVAGSENFYVLTRYNRSSYYALAVIALGEAVRATVAAPAPAAAPAPSAPDR
jgi:membrane-bound lytic murein transglycosylase B